jgi:hypothetical protein
MKTSIIRIKMRSLKNETHVQFNESVNAVFVKHNPQLIGIEPLYALYRAALDNELLALDFIRKSEITEKIAEQDRARDGVYRGFVETVKGATHHFDRARVEAANILYGVFSHYGNIARKTFDDETAAINDLARELQQPEYAAAIALLDLQSWLDRLIDENSSFERLMLERYDESAQKTPLRMAAARVETDRYYHAVVSQIENLLLAGNAPNVDTCAREINAVVDRFKAILAQETAKKKNSKIETLKQ